MWLIIKSVHLVHSLMEDLVSLLVHVKKAIFGIKNSLNANVLKVLLKLEKAVFNVKEE